MDEFDAVGLEREPSALVAPPRVAASPVALECALHSTLASATPRSSSAASLPRGREEVLEAGRPEVRRLQPLSRMGANEWGSDGEVRTIARIRHDDWPGHYGDRAPDDESPAPS